MDRLIYTAYSGMTGSTVRQRVIASNMANAQTIGFRAEMLTTTPMTLKGPSLEARAMTDGEVRGASMAQGTLIATGKPLDVALTGDTITAERAHHFGMINDVCQPGEAVDAALALGRASVVGGALGAGLRLQATLVHVVAVELLERSDPALLDPRAEVRLARTQEQHARPRRARARAPPGAVHV
ncbi:MAG: flagellar basal body protein, partial [Novosphingobium sp.]